MPQFKVIERRMHEVEYLIEADDEQAARQLDGSIVEENSTDDWGYEVVSVEAIEPDDVLTW